MTGGANCFKKLAGVSEATTSHGSKFQTLKVLRKRITISLYICLLLLVCEIVSSRPSNSVPGVNNFQYH